MGKIITAPEMLDISDINKHKVFLAGGISNCPDWQEPVAKRIADETNLLVINPRRNDWNMDSQAVESIEQIHWEHFYLNMSNHILFWFPEETLCPITLFELGAALKGDANIFVGTHSNYGRRLDVCVQTNLARPRTHVYQTLDSMVSDFIHDILEHG